MNATRENGDSGAAVTGDELHSEAAVSTGADAHRSPRRRRLDDADQLAPPEAPAADNERRPLDQFQARRNGVHTASMPARGDLDTPDSRGRESPGL